MGGQAVELVQRAFDAWRRRDPEGLVALYDPGAEIDLRGLDLPDAQVLHGRGAMLEFLAALVEHFPDVEFRDDEVVERRGWVLARGRLSAHSRATGLRTEQDFSEAVLVRDGLIVRDLYFREPDGASDWVERQAAPLLVAVPNLSEGRDLAKLGRLEASVAPARVLDVHTDADHNRSVFTLAARQGGLAGGLVGLARAAVAEIDLRAHEGVHPHAGALDVMPIVWTSPELRGAACAEVLTAAALVGADVGVPVFLYGELATRPEHRERAWIRRGGPTELARRMAAGELVPDYGPARAHPSAGAVLAGARPPLLAFNVDLDTDDVELAKRIAAELRESGGGPAGVRALGLYLAGRGRAQVSTNVHDHHAVRLREIVERVRARAPVAEAELIGLAPRAAFEGFPDDVPLRGFSPDRHILEEALNALESSP